MYFLCIISSVKLITHIYLLLTWRIRRVSTPCHIHTILAMRTTLPLLCKFLEWMGKQKLVKVQNTVRSCTTQQTLILFGDTNTVQLFYKYNNSVNAGLLGQHWKWRQYVPPKCWYLPLRPNGVKTQKANVDIFTTVRTSLSHKNSDPTTCNCQLSHFLPSKHVQCLTKFQS
jgi:hypothetical protein